MEEVSAPVIAIALILSAVFVPTAFIPGITGRLYQQFAVTIAVSVIISAFNALTLSPALSALLLRPKKEARGPLGAFFRWFNRVLRARDRRLRRLVPPPDPQGRAVACCSSPVIAVLAGFFGSRLPTELPARGGPGLLLHERAAARRGVAAAHRRGLRSRSRSILKDTPGVQSYNTVVGFSLLSGVNTTYSGFFFVTLKPWDERDAGGPHRGRHHAAS